MTEDQRTRVIEMWVGCYDVADIVASTGLTPFEVRAEINRVDPPDRGPAFLLPNTSGIKSNYVGAIQDVRIDPVDNRRPRDIVASLRKQGETQRRKRQPVECGTLAAYSRHHRKRQTPCDACKAAMRDYTRKRRGTA